MKRRWLPVMSMLVLFLGAGQACATGVDDVPSCPDYELSRSQQRSLEKMVRAETGLRVERRTSTSCSQGRYVDVYLETRQAKRPDGSEHSYFVECSFGLDEGWKCKYTESRFLRVGNHWRNGDATVYIPLDADAVVARSRLEEALALSTSLATQHLCEASDGASQQLLELRSDLGYPWGVTHLSLDESRVTLWTSRYAVHFTAEAPGARLVPRCWRPRKEFECRTSKCPP